MWHISKFSPLTRDLWLCPSIKGVGAGVWKYSGERHSVTWCPPDDIAAELIGSLIRTLGHTRRRDTLHEERVAMVAAMSCSPVGIPMADCAKGYVAGGDHMPRVVPVHSRCNGHVL